MKYFILTILSISLLASVHARTWTSADGKNYFSGIYLRSDATTMTVYTSDQVASVKLALVSEEDQAWVRAEEKRLLAAEKEETTEKAALKNQYIGKRLIGTTSAVVDKKFQAKDTAKVPELYFIYYSASW